jgi:hypothetical protein
MKLMGIDPKNKIIAVPIPHETGMVFGSIPRAFFDQLVGGRHDAIYSAIKDAIKTVIPVFAKSGGIPQAIAPLMEVRANESHWGKKIVPPSMTSTFTPLLSEDQRFPWSSRLSIELSTMLRKLSKATGDDYDFNPIQLDYMLSQYTGSLGSKMLAFAEDTIWGTKSGRSSILDVTLRMPHRPSRQIAFFYLEYNELAAKKGSKKITGAELNRYKTMKKFKKYNLDPLNDKKKKIGIPSGEADVEKFRKIHKVMATRLNRFLGSKYEDLK